MEVKLTVLAVVASVSRQTLTDVAIQNRLTRSSIGTRTALAVVDYCEQKEQILRLIVSVYYESRNRMKAITIG